MKTIKFVDEIMPEVKAEMEAIKIGQQLEIRNMSGRKEIITVVSEPWKCPVLQSYVIWATRGSENFWATRGSENFIAMNIYNSFYGHHWAETSIKV